MYNCFIIYLIIVTYLLIGYYIHGQSIKIIAENKFLITLYNQLTNKLKIALFSIITLFWLPIVVGEFFIVLLNWFAKTYNDMD